MFIFINDISGIYFNELQLENIWPFLRKQFIFIFVKFGQCKIKLLAFASFFEIWEISEKKYSELLLENDLLILLFISLKILKFSLLIAWKLSILSYAFWIFYTSNILIILNL